MSHKTQLARLMVLIMAIAAAFAAFVRVMSCSAIDGRDPAWDNKPRIILGDELKEDLAAERARRAKTKENAQNGH